MNPLQDFKNETNEVRRFKKKSKVRILKKEWFFPSIHLQPPKYKTKDIFNNIMWLIY